MKINHEAFLDAALWVRNLPDVRDRRPEWIVRGVLTITGVEVEQPGVTGNSLEKCKISRAKRDATLKRVVAALGPNVPPYVTETVMNHVLNALDVEVERPKTDAEKIADFVAAIRAEHADEYENWPMLRDLICVHLGVDL